MKRVILDSDSVSRRELMDKGSDFITPRYAEDQNIYAFYEDRMFNLVSKVGDDYKIIPLITGKIDTNRFKTLRGAVKHCLKKKRIIWEFDNSKELSLWVLNKHNIKVS